MAGSLCQQFVAAASYLCVSKQLWWLISHLASHARDECREERGLAVLLI